MKENQNDSKKGINRFDKEINFSNQNEIEENVEVKEEVLDEPQEPQQELKVKEISSGIEEEPKDIDKEDAKEKQTTTIDDIVKTQTVSSSEIEKPLEETAKSLENEENSQANKTEELDKTQEISQSVDNNEQAVLEQATTEYQAPKFVIDIDEEAYNVSDFENEETQNQNDQYYNEEEYYNEEDNEENPKKRKKKTSALGMFFRIILAFIVVGIIAFCAIAGVYAYGDISGISGNGISVKVSVPPDTYVSDVGEILKEKGIIKYPQIFKLYIKYIHKKDVDLHYGNFNLNSSMGYSQLIKTLENPAQSESGIRLTVREGETITDIANRLEESHICKASEFLDVVKNGKFEYSFLSEIENPDERPFKLEGYLFPDTYNFKQDTKPEEIVKRMLSNFESKFTEEMKYAIKISPFSLDEIMRLASIIQAEAPTKPDMMKVSSVYRNRLANTEEYPKLQADPTSKYANRVLIPSGASQELATKYDTYKIDGLPLGPINNPGLEAILSAIYPATTDYYYFCSDLTSGQFYYAQTYDVHKENLKLAGLTENEAVE